MHYCAMAYNTRFSNVYWKSWINMNSGIVLNIASVANVNMIGVTAQYGTIPNAYLIA
jgi:hypothetical protein